MGFVAPGTLRSRPRAQHVLARDQLAAAIFEAAIASAYACDSLLIINDYA